MSSRTKRKVVIATGLALFAASCGDSVDDTSPSAPNSTSSEVSPTSVPVASNDSLADGSIPIGDGAIQLVARVKDRELSPEADGDAVNAVIAGTNQFAVDLFKTIADPTEDTVVGNYSLSTVLMLTMAGTNAETTAAFADLLGVADVDPTELHRP